MRKVLTAIAIVVVVGIGYCALTSAWLFATLARSEVPKGFEVKNSIVSTQVLMNCSAVAYALELREAATPSLFQEIGKLARNDDFERQMIETTISWGKRCFGLKDYDEEFLAAVREPSSLLYSFDINKNLMLYSCGQGRLYIVKRS